MRLFHTGKVIFKEKILLSSNVKHEILKIDYLYIKSSISYKKKLNNTEIKNLKVKNYSFMENFEMLTKSQRVLLFKK